MPTKRGLATGVGISMLLIASAVHLVGQTASSDKVLAVVNGTNITQGDLDFLLLSRRIPAQERETVKARFLEILIEQQLMREYLESRKAKPSKTELDQQVARVLKVIRDGGDDPEKVLAKMGMTESSLREELALPLTWASYLRLLVTGQGLRQYFEKHRSRFDGTQVRVRQIFLNVPQEADEAAVTAAEKKLATLKQEIESQSITFAEAAMRDSEAPSKTEGGDTGWISYRGKLPAALSDAAFALKDNEISHPIRTRFGLHLITITERKPGDVSLEDVRAVVFNALSQELWRETVKSQKQKAKIEIR